MSEEESEEFKEEITLINAYFEYNSSNPTSNVPKLMSIMTEDIIGEYPSGTFKGKEYEKHVTKTLKIADAISQHKVYPTNFSFKKINEQIDATVNWEFEMYFKGCSLCCFICCTCKCFCCNFKQTNPIKQHGINYYRFYNDPNTNHKKICYVKTVTQK